VALDDEAPRGGCLVAITGGIVMVKGLRRRMLIVLAVAMSMVFGTPLVVGATGRNGPSHGHGTNHGRYHVEFVRQQVGQADITQITGPNGEQVFSFSGSGTLSGDLQGTTFGAGSVGLVSDEVESGATAGVSIWTITASPCGTGSLAVFAAGPFGTDAPTSWQIAAGGGTGDLVDMQGGGTSTTSPDGSATWVGDIRCS